MLSARGEQGQVIVLFVVVFSIILVVAAFAVDQGFWYGRRRVVQKDADLAARAGALAYLNANLSESKAETAARSAAIANGADADTVEVVADASSCVDRAGNTITAPSVEVRLDTDARRFFSGLGLISDDNSPIEVQASSTACVGSATGIFVANGNDPEDDENTLKGLPIALRVDSGDCTNSGQLRYGQECRIFGRAASRRAVVGGQRNPSPYCDRPFSGSQLDDDIEDGVSFKCHNGDDLDLVQTSASQFYVVMRAIEERLDRNTDCESNEEPNDQSFQNAFGNADGTPSLAPDPPPLGGSASPMHVYVQNDCFDNPRIVALPMYESAGNDDVAGVALVYITGCYETGDVPSPSERENEDCYDAAFWAHAAQHNHWYCGWWVDCDARAQRYEIRAIPVRYLAAREAIGGFTAPTGNAPLTIQTVR